MAALSARARATQRSRTARSAPRRPAPRAAPRCAAREGGGARREALVGANARAAAPPTARAHAARRISHPAPPRTHRLTPLALRAAVDPVDAVGNWKCNPESLGEALALARLVGAAARGAASDGAAGGVTVGVVPPAPFLAPVAECLREFGGGRVAVGAQDVHTERAGAYTGAASAPQLRSAGAQFALVGHSERRALFGDDDEAVNAKLRAALAAGLRAILCVGETLEERELGVTDAVVATQLAKGLAGVDAAQMAAGNVAIAYEPVWAIGTGRVATPAQAQLVHAAARSWLEGAYGRAVADSVVIQYGGSVTPEAVDELMACPDVDGVLVGGASLKAEAFARIATFRSPSTEAEAAAAAAAHAQRAAENAARAADAARANAAAVAASAGGGAPPVVSHATEVVPCGNVLGESPVWSVAEQCLYWVSSVGKELWRWDGASPAVRRGLPEVVGCCALVAGANSTALVALEHRGIGTFDMRTGAFSPIVDAWEPGQNTRPNDGRVDREGNFVIAGYNNIHRADALESSGVYCLPAEGGELVRIRDGNVRCSNATCFSPDGTTMYFCDTPQRRLLAYAYAPGAPLGEGRVVWEMPAGLAGGPDGAQTDAQGGVWMALSGAGRVSRVDPATGRVTHEIRLPCDMPTSVTVGGADLDTLYITTRKPDGGGLFAAPMPAGLRGLPEPEYGAPSTKQNAPDGAPAAALTTTTNGMFVDVA